MSDLAASGIPSGLTTSRRNTWFNGKFLTERDFAAEQAYLVGKDRLHNAYLHGTGTVCGLAVTAHPNEDCRRRYLVLEPGMALDCRGREIVVPRRTVIDVRKQLVDQGLVPDPQRPQDLFVRLCYDECGDERVPVILPDCDCADGDTTYNRVAETFRVSLDLTRAGALPPVRPPSTARLDWVQTLVLQEQRVTAMAFDQENGQIYVATLSEYEGSRLLVYDATTHDLITAVETGLEVYDLAVSPRGDLVYVAGRYSTCDDGIAVYREADLRGPDPDAPVIEIDGALRLVVSGDGTLFAVALDAGDVFAWQEVQIQSWLADGPAGGPPQNRRRFSLGHPVSGDSSLRAGANAVEVSADGRLLFLLDDVADAGRQLRIVDITRLFSGAAGGEPDDEITVPVDLRGAPVALAVAFDGRYVYVLTQVDDRTAGLDRYRLSNDGGVFAVTPDGRGGEWPALATDLSLAAGEKWAYVLERGDDDRASVVSLSVDAIASLDDQDPVNPAGSRIGVSGSPGFQRLAATFGRVYVAADDSVPDAQPDRGLVAVIDVRENDCGALFDRIVDGCPGCADEDGDDHCVTIAHIPRWAPDTPMQDAGESHDGDLHIDNHTHRPLVPSSNTIVDVVRCMLDQGVAQGRPGPRGPAGLPGRDGVDGADGQDGRDGQNGQPGRDGLAGRDGRDGRDGVDGRDGEGLTDDLTHITAISWIHDRDAFRIDDLDAVWRELGLVIAFDRPVLVSSVLGSRENDPRSEVFTLFARVEQFGGLVEVIVTGLVCEPCRVESSDADGRITSVTGLPMDTEFADAVRLRVDDQLPATVADMRPLTYRVLFRADFVRDEAGEFAVDGDHVFGAVPDRPSGNRLPGGSFESWFDVRV